MEMTRKWKEMKGKWKEMKAKVMEMKRKMKGTEAQRRGAQVPRQSAHYGPWRGVSRAPATRNVRVSVFWSECVNECVRVSVLE